MRIPVVNTTSKPVKLHEDTYSGITSPVAIISDEKPNDAQAECSSVALEQDVQGAPPDALAPIVAEFHESLTHPQQQKAEQLLRKFEDIFSKGLYDMGRTTVVEHHIDTGDIRPIR